jgi:hypothetical protein
MIEVVGQAIIASRNRFRLADASVERVRNFFTQCDCSEQRYRRPKKGHADSQTNHMFFAFKKGSSDKESVATAAAGWHWLAI